MSYEEFLEKVKEGIQKYLPDEYASNEAQIIKKMINNGAFYYGLAVRRQGSNIAPILKLDAYYEKYMYGCAFEEILREIAATYYKRDVGGPVINVEDFLYENVKDKIFVEVCNAERNKSDLASAPHEIKQDLALRYYVFFEYPDGGVGKVCIRHAHLSLWNISEEELKKQAWDNMKYVSKPSLQSLEQVTGEYIGTLELDMNDEAPDMYILSNEKALYGAAYLFDDFVMHSLTEILNDDLLVLPSSVNEVLIMKKSIVNEQRTITDLRKLVETVNRQCMSPEEFLSDEVYLYEKDIHQLSIANDEEQQLGMSMNM